MFPHSEPVLSVIVPVYNGGDLFRKCLESINGADPPPEEVIVVADGESDGAWRTARDMGMQVINLPATAGPAYARNRGAAAARGNVLMFVDADVTVPGGLFGRVTDAFRDAPRMTAVFGSYDDSPWDPGFLSQYKNLFHHFVHQNAGSDASTFWAGCGAIRRDVFSGIGGFDESYRHPSIEDIELGCRLKAAGHSLRLDKGMQVKHLKRWRPLVFIRTEFFFRALPWVKLILQRRCVSTGLNVTVRDAIGVGGVYLLLFFVWGAAALGWSVLPVAVFAGALALMHKKLYAFFYKKHGLTFAVRALCMHWFYLFYCGAAVITGLVQHFLTGGSGKSSR